MTQVGVEPTTPNPNVFLILLTYTVVTVPSRDVPSTLKWRHSDIQKPKERHTKPSEPLFFLHKSVMYWGQAFLK